MKYLIPVVLSLLLSSCITVPWESSGKFYGAEDFKDYDVLDQNRIKGKGCRTWPFILGFLGWGTATIPAAYADALEQAPEGTEGLSDAEFYQTDFTILLISQKCYVVEGYPARRK